MIQGEQDLRHDLPHLPDGDERAGLDHVFQCAGVDVFHHDVGPPVLLHEVEHSDNVRMQTAPCGLRLPREPLQKGVRVAEVVEEFRSKSS